VDVLSDVLRAVRLTGAIFFDVEARVPWVATTPEAVSIGGKVMPQSEHVIMFHAIISGGCWAELLDDSMPPTRLETGDIIVLPMGDAHVLCSKPGMRTEANIEQYRRPTDRSLPIVISGIGGGGAEQAHFVCGYLGCDARPGHCRRGAKPWMRSSRALQR
jgi:Cupin